MDESGFVSQRVHAQQITPPDYAPPEYKLLTTGAMRLSLNIRFRRGMVKLNNKAIRDVQRLAKFVQRAENKKKKIMLFGFSHSLESLPFASYALSVTRADTVADQLILNHITPSKIRGYDAEQPIANNKTEQGNGKSRRVEIWIK